MGSHNLHAVFLMIIYSGPGRLRGLRVARRACCEMRCSEPAGMEELLGGRRPDVGRDYFFYTQRNRGGTE